MQGKIIFNRPSLCECVISINKKVSKIKGEEIFLPYGEYEINVGISNDEYLENSKVYESITWAYKEPQKVTIDYTPTKIEIKRKMHLFHPISCKADIIKIFE